MSGAGAPTPLHHPHANHSASCGCALRPQPLQQSLDELEFERSACKAALDGDVARLQKLEQNRPHLLDEASGGAGLVPLHYASRAGKKDAALFLLSRAPWRAFCLSNGGATPLHKAAACGHDQIVDMLLRGCAKGDEDADAAARSLAMASDSDGATALHLACASGRRECAELLLKRCPEAANVRDKRGRTPRDRWREQEGGRGGGDDDGGALPWPPSSSPD